MDIPDTRKQLAEAVVTLLRRSAVSMKLAEIVTALRRMGLAVTGPAVNSVLYAEMLRGNVLPLDSQFRWSVPRCVARSITASPTPIEPAQQPPARPHITGTSPAPDDAGRTARRVLHVLRSGTTSARAAKAISVGTAHIEQELYHRIDALRHGTKGDMIVISADWGFGKSHMRMLLSGQLSERRIPFVHECVDGRAASLSHIHRAVPRWLERIRFGQTVGLRDALENRALSPERALEWAAKEHSDFAHGLRAALGGWDWGWLRALGHLYRTPDYPYQHLKAWSLLEAVASFLNNLDCSGLVLLLDEAENIDKQYDIRGRRRSYDTLARMAMHAHILPVLFVTDRLHYQVEQDYRQGIADGWSHWSPEAKWFVVHFRGIEPLRPPALTNGLAEELVSSILRLYESAYPTLSTLTPDRVLSHWRRTPTRSTRLLVRLTINELDLLAQDAVQANTR